MTVIQFVIGAFRTDPKELVKELEELEIREVVTIQTKALFGQKTLMSPWALKRIAVTQTPVRNHPLTLLWKTFKGVNNYNNNNNPTGHVLKVNADETVYKYLNITRKLKKFWNMTVIPIIIRVLEKFPTEPEKETG